MVNKKSNASLVILALLVLIGLGGYVLHRQSKVPELETHGSSTIEPQEEFTPTDAPKDELSLTPKDVETASTDVVVRRWEEHIKRIGAKRVRKKTMKLVQQAMSASGQERVDYLRAAVKLEPQDEAISKMLIHAEKLLAATKRKRKKARIDKKTLPTRRSLSPAPPLDTDVIVQPRIIED